MNPFAGMSLWRLAIVLLGLLALSVLVWFVGPMVSLMGYAPWVPETNRWITIGSIFAIWILVLLWRRWRIRRANARMIKSMMDSEGLVALTENQTRDEVDVMRERFEEALDILRQNAIGGQRGKNFMFQLPWYVIIGPPGSGKSTVLRNSGLEFPLAERLGGESIQGVGGTRNCDWWFTDRAVLIDTAGRYTTQDANIEVDRAAWRGFLDLLKEFRRRRPINGVMLAISLSDILTQSDAERKAHVDAIKRRLQELMRSFGMRLPVYVLITKCDLLAGFTEFFDDLDADEREQVWGMTFPVDMQLGALPQEIEKDLRQIVERVQHRVLERLHSERDVRRRGRIFAFPQQLAGVRPVLAQFVNEIFRSTRYEMAPLLRGVYLTSGTQEGTPIDRLMGAFSRSFGLESGAEPLLSGAGKAFFIKRLLGDVIFEEQDLVGTNKALERRLALGQAAGYGIAGLVVAAFAGLWWFAFNRTEGKVEEIQHHANNIQTSLQQLPAQADLNAALPLLNQAYALKQIYPEGVIVSWLENVGLSAQASLSPRLAAAYDRVLARVFAPRVGRIFERQLQQAMQRDPRGAETREILRTYLMLSDSEHFEADTVQQRLDATWKTIYALQPDRQAELNRHTTRFVNLLPQLDRPPTTANSDLVNNVRGGLVSVPPAIQLYEKMRQDAFLSPSLPAFDLVNVLGPSAQQVMQGQGDSGLRIRIPGLYTRDGFYNYLIPRLPTLARGQLQNDWVLGGPETEANSELDRVTAQVADMYVKDYIQSWQQLLGRLQLQPFTDVAAAQSSLQMLASPDSPLVKLINAVKTNTDLPSPGAQAQAAAGGGVAGGGIVGNVISAARSAAGGAANQSAQAALGTDYWPGDKIRDPFRPLVALTEATGAQVPGINRIQDLIAALYGMINNVAAAQSPTQAAYQLVTQRQQSGANDAITALRTESATKPEPVRSLMRSMSAGTFDVMLSMTRQHVNAAWQRDILPVCQRVIFRRYPVYSDAQQETTLKDFADFFRPGGLLDDFFKKNMSPFATSDGTSIRSAQIDGRSIGFADASMDQFQRAQAIRNAFFPDGGASPTVKFSLTPTFLDPKALRVMFEIDSTRLIYRHEAPRTRDLQWPNQADASTVAVTLTDVDNKSSKIMRSGSWAWFRLLDDAGLAPTTAPDKYTFTVQSESGIKAIYELQANSVTNPFNLPQLKEFRCPAAL